MMASLTYYAFLFSIFLCSSGRRLWGIIECPRKMEEYGISKNHFHFEPKYVAYFEENVFFGATSIEAHMTLWSALSACKTVNGYITVGNLIINVHFFSLELTFIHLKEQYLAEQEGQVQVSCFCLESDEKVTNQSTQCPATLTWYRRSCSNPYPLLLLWNFISCSQDMLVHEQYVNIILNKQKIYIVTNDHRFVLCIMHASQ